MASSKIINILFYTFSLAALFNVRIVTAKSGEKSDEIVVPNPALTPIEPEKLKFLKEEAVDWAQNIGMIMRRRQSRDSNNDLHSDEAEVAPFTIFPSSFPRGVFQKAIDLQASMTLLYFRVARDHEFLKEAYGELAETDETIKRLFSILDDVHAEGVRQPNAMIWQRADYMCHVNMSSGEPKYELKQIEVNNGAAGGFIGHYATELHRRILAKVGVPEEKAKAVMPDNEPLNTLGQGLYHAWKLFGNKNAIVVVVEPKGGALTHFVDHEIELELEKLSGGKIKTAFLNWKLCSERMKLADDYTLMLDDKVVAVVFYRVTYLSPIAKLVPENWAIRRVIERSTAIVLARPGMVERFFPDKKDAEKVAAIRSTFAGLWGLEHDNAETRELIQDAIDHPDRYVLKPNREGGGYNIWNQDIVTSLQKFTPIERAQHILMQRLQPMVTKNYFVRPLHEPEYGDVVSELSPFGVLVGNMKTGKVLFQRAHGYFMRTKWAHVNEGGIMKGTGVYDSPLLF